MRTKPVKMEESRSAGGSLEWGRAKGKRKRKRRRKKKN